MCNYMYFEYFSSAKTILFCFAFRLTQQFLSYQWRLVLNGGRERPDAGYMYIL
jgi:hypothetical protein